jgi:hypothetical protein
LPSSTIIVVANIAHIFVVDIVRARALLDFDWKPVPMTEIQPVMAD